MSTLTVPAPPARRVQQRRDALGRANHVRIARSELKREVSAGRIRVEGLLVDPPAEILTMKIFDLLIAIPNYGRVRVSRTLGRCSVSPMRPIGGMSERQRREMAALLGARRVTVNPAINPHDVLEELDVKT